MQVYAAFVLTHVHYIHSNTSLHCNKKMSRDDQMCTSCSQAKASSFCFCDEVETFLCELCFFTHYKDSPRLMHIAIPMSAYGLHKAPRYYERLQSRSAKVQIAKAEAMKNLDAIDRCIEAISVETDKVVKAVRDYEIATVAKLQEVKREFEAEISSAIAEVDGTLYAESPSLPSQWAKKIREFDGDKSSLQYFTYKINCAEMLTQLKLLCDYAVLRPLPEVLPLVGISGNSLTTYSIENAEKQVHSLSTEFSDGVRVCFVSETTLLLVGSDPASDSVFTLNLPNTKLTQMQSMITPRYLPALIVAEGFAYVFGGEGRECEKYQCERDVWSSLPDMHTGKLASSTCKYKNQIYLVDVNSGIETFDLSFQEFKLLDIELNGLRGDSLALLVGTKIVIVCNGKLGRWRMGTEQITVMNTKVADFIAISQCQPMQEKGVVYFAAYPAGALWAICIDTGEGRKLE